MLIGISGKARSGKDTFAMMLAKELQKRTGRAYVLMAYAHELKLKIQRDFDLSYEQLWGDEKEIEDKRYRKPLPDDIGVPSKGIIHYWTAREIMQNYGQFFRTIDYDFWVKNLFKVVDEKEIENVIITDLRHLNEVNVVVDRGGYHIRVKREDKDNVHNEQHISETALDGGHKVDFTVMNYGTLKDLEESTVGVVKFLIEINKKEK